MIHLMVGAPWGTKVAETVAERLNVVTHPPLFQLLNPTFPSTTAQGIKNAYDRAHTALLDLVPRPERLYFLNGSAIVPATVLEMFECINFHCTALPYGRGGHPIENLILRGHRTTVITAHRMTDQIDGGPIYLRSAAVSLLGSKAEILDGFVGPIVEMIEEIEEVEWTPSEQEGDVTRFQRLPSEVCDAVWTYREWRKKLWLDDHGM